MLRLDIPSVRRWGAPLVALFVLAALGCDEDASKGQSPDTLCGVGTTYLGGICVVDPDTGGGTADTTGGDDASDTTVNEDTTATDDSGSPDSAETTDTDASGAETADGAACTPNCAGLKCGPDGCGGNCGTCSGDAKHCQGGQCVATCEPACGGKTCGDDGCGGSCGGCDGGGVCSKLGACVPKEWTCDPIGYNGDGVCDCNCGTVDPDCVQPGLPVQGCKPGEVCPDGKSCKKGPATGWTCEASYFDENVNKPAWSVYYCDCACGAYDPDCDDPKLSVLGCPSGASCQADGTCSACKPSCDGKTCGPDGCGKLCGLCNDPTKPVCENGVCLDKCQPKCADQTCGPDGCGGSCGTCKGGEACAIGHCQKLPDADSCALSKACGKMAPGGCSCAADCVPGASCCLDVDVACGCQPVCGDKKCGSDGCGGSCGSCGANEACDNGVCLKDPCKPDPCGGKGACQPSPDAKTATCTCVQGYKGDACGACADGYVGFPDCKQDLCFNNACNNQGTCDAKTGVCACKKDFTGAYCHLCLDSKKKWPDCDKPLPPCYGQSCNGQGVCDTTTNKCECNQGFVGDDCGKCADDKLTYPQCSGTEPKGCTMTCKGKGACIKFNTCLCLPGFTGANCELCSDKTKTWPDCGAVVSSEYAPDPALAGLGCDFCGVPLKQVQFTADPTDKEPPQLKILLPPEGTILAPGMPVVAIVDDILDPATVTPATFRVTPASNANFTIAGSVAMQVTPTKATVLVFFPSNLNVSGAFKVFLEGVKDKGGNALAPAQAAFQIGGVPQGSFAGNDGFEAGVSGCYLLGDAGTSAASDNMTPTTGTSMLALTTFNEKKVGAGPALLNRASMVFCGPIDVPAGKTKLLFDFNFASAEFDESVGSTFDDLAVAALSSEKGGVGGVVTSVNIIGNAGLPTSAFGLPDQGDPVAKMSGWKTATINQPGKLGAKVFVTFIVSDVFDDVYTSVLAVDNLRFE